MNPLFLVFGVGMGTYVAQPQGSSIPYSGANTAFNYRQNDGVVNSLGTRYPTTNINANIVSQYTNFANSFTMGNWNHLAFKSTWDHFDIIGGDPTIDVTNFYINIATLLYSVPSSSSFSVNSSLIDNLSTDAGNSSTVNCTNLRQQYIQTCGYGKANTNTSAAYCNATSNYLESIGCDNSLPENIPSGTTSILYVDLTKTWLIAVIALMAFFNGF